VNSYKKASDSQQPLMI